MSVPYRTHLDLSLPVAGLVLAVGERLEVDGGLAEQGVSDGGQQEVGGQVHLEQRGVCA